MSCKRKKQAAQDRSKHVRHTDLHAGKAGTLNLKVYINSDPNCLSGYACHNSHGSKDQDQPAIEKWETGRNEREVGIGKYRNFQKIIVYNEENLVQRL